MIAKRPLFRSGSLATRLSLCLCMAASVCVLAGCDLTRNYSNIDRSGDMDMQDYRDAMAQRLPEAEKEKAGDNVPALQPYIASPSGSGKSMPLVSVTVNQDVPLRDVLYELASQAEYDVELDPRISGSIIFTARNRPLDEVVDRIAEVSGLRYKFDNDMMRVEIDTPYHQNYSINYLSYMRSNESTVGNSISVVSGEGADTGSSFSATAKSESDFWGELDTNLTQLLGGTQGDAAMTGTTTPAAGAAPPPLQPVVGEMPVDPATLEPAAGEDAMITDPAQPARFSMNRQAGMVSVFAPERLQKRVAAYLDELKKSVTAQVLIEAKVLEVSLNDEFSAGIDWSTLDLFGGEGLIGFDANAGGLVRGVLATSTGPTTNFRFSQNGNDFTAVIDAISRFGTVQALASPRLTVLNNQSAVLNVAQNQVYFEISIETTTNDNVSQTTVDSEIRNVPEGVIINVQPSIDLVDRQISMAVRPTVTRITDFVDDPAVAFASANLAEPIASQIPVVNVQEFDSVIQMGSGQAMVMGGLIQDRTTSEQNSVPVLGEVPLVGSLFRNQRDRVQKTELIVLLKATIVEGGDNAHATDKDLYRGFSRDRRPFEL